MDTYFASKCYTEKVHENLQQPGTVLQITFRHQTDERVPFRPLKLSVWETVQFSYFS